MALVSYDYDSNESEEEDEEQKNEKLSGVVEIVKQDPQVSNGIEEPLESSSSIFDKLPKTKEIKPIEEDEVEDFIPKAPAIKEKPKVKITIPSLSEFDDLEAIEPVVKKFKPSSNGSGLLSILPPVKSEPLSAQSFIPNILKQKAKASTITKSNTLNKTKAATNKKLEKKVKSHTGNESDTDNEEIELPETFDEEMWKKLCGRREKKIILKEEEPIPEIEINAAPEATQPYEGLNNEAFKELVGSAKRIPGNIKFIDINEEEILPDKDIWMAKSLTDPEYVPKPVVENPVDPTRKRKHHITYLAEQAKANEQDLKNQWSSSKYNRNQTRAKYGF